MVLVIFILLLLISPSIPQNDDYSAPKSKRAPISSREPDAGVNCSFAEDSEGAMQDQLHCALALFGRWRRDGGVDKKGGSSVDMVVEGTPRWLPSAGCGSGHDGNDDHSEPLSKSNTMEGGGAIVAIVQRGGCSFGLKAITAAKFGAVALVVVNSNDDEDPFPMGVTDAEAKEVSNLVAVMVPAAFLSHFAASESVIDSGNSGVHSKHNSSTVGVSTGKFVIRRRQRRPKSGHKQQALLFASMAEELSAHGRYSDALRQLQAATSIDPKSPEHWMKLLWMKQDLCEWENLELTRNNFQHAVSAALKLAAEKERIILAQATQKKYRSSSSSSRQAIEDLDDYSDVVSLCPRLSPSLALPSHLVTEICSLFSSQLSPHHHEKEVEDTPGLLQRQTTHKLVNLQHEKKDTLVDSTRRRVAPLRLGYTSSFLLQQHPLRFVLGGAFRRQPHNDQSHHRFMFSLAAVTCIHTPVSSNSSRLPLLGCDREVVVSSGRDAVYGNGEEEGATILRNEFINLDVLIDIDGHTRPRKSMDRRHVRAVFEAKEAKASATSTTGLSSGSSGRGSVSPFPSLVQIHYLGTPQYPLAMAGVDYFASDSFLTPPDRLASSLTASSPTASPPSSPWLAREEKLLLLPHYMSYFPTDPHAFPPLDIDKSECDSAAAVSVEERHLKKNEVLPHEAIPKTKDDNLGGGAGGDDPLSRCHHHRKQKLSTRARVRHSLLGAHDDDVTLFACFNQGKKIEPVLFSAWMQILVATHNSKLWLPQVHNKEARRWLRAEAAARGVPDHRMVFSKRREDDRNIYLSTIVAADIALDTVKYSGGSVALEVLLQGVPLVVLASLSTVASRQATSIANTALSPMPLTHSKAENDDDGRERANVNSLRMDTVLVTHSLKEYTDVALRLASRVTVTAPRSAGCTNSATLFIAHHAMISEALNSHCSSQCTQASPPPVLAVNAGRLPNSRCSCPLFAQPWMRDMKRGAAAAYEVKLACLHDLAARSATASSSSNNETKKGSTRGRSLGHGECDPKGLSHIVVTP